ncbi:MAG TPA: hypothetical protein VFJ89_09270 [Nocardioides sp.]|nr:hypothetical protein [Nocardioides sp.]
MTRLRLLAVALLATLLGTGTGVVVRGAPDPAPVGSRVAALAVLRAWDAARSRAWAEGDAAALSALYVPGSAAGRADRRLLGAYAARGLRVEGLVMQVLAVRVVRAEPDRWVLRVTDRVASATAVGRGTRIALPRDEPSTWMVVLRHVGGRWRVGSVSGCPAYPAR